MRPAKARPAASPGQRTGTRFGPAAATLVLPPSPLFGPWGLLPIAVPCALFLAVRLGTLVFPAGRGSDRAIAGAVLAAALVIASVRLLGAAHALTGPALLGSWLASAVVLAALSRSARRVVPVGELATRATAPLLAAAAVAVGAATLAAVWLPVWQWDALGYHLPYVNFALVAHGLDGVPDDMPYVSTYPHDAEALIIALRAMLPDDRLVDLAQIPCALMGAVATAGIARRCGAKRAPALAAGAAWVVVPAVFLQMPTDYVDVASAALLLAALYFVLSASDASSGAVAPGRALVVGGLALSLYLGTKPNAPLSAAVVVALLSWVGVRARQRSALVLALVLVALGGETFLFNTFRYGNPVWPVEVRIGPLLLHGKTTMQHLLDSGAAAPHLHGPLPSRILHSWTSLTSPPVFDMRIGGFGVLVLAAAPAALVTLLRRKDVVSWGAIGAAVIAPDPSVARYVLGLPALLLAFAAPRAGVVPARWRSWVGALVGALALAQIVYAWPGLSGEGPPLSAYARMSDAERAQAVGADGPPTPFIEARRRIGPGETFAFDQSLELPYLAWESDLRYRAVWIPDTLQTSRAIEDFFVSENVRIVAAAEGSPVAEWLTQNQAAFQKLFQCKSAPCSVFARR